MKQTAQSSTEANQLAESANKAAGKDGAMIKQTVKAMDGIESSAQTASDIKTLIQDSNNQVKNGVDLVNQAGQSLGEIVGSIGKVAGIIQGISSAAQEQAASVQEINNSVAGMDEMTQQNSALVEQSAASARTLGNQTGKLTELMAFFKNDSARAAGPLGGAAPGSMRPSCPKSLTQNESNDFIVLQSRSGEEEVAGRCGASVKADDEACVGCGATLRVALSAAPASSPAACGAPHRGASSSSQSLTDKAMKSLDSFWVRL